MFWGLVMPGLMLIAGGVYYLTRSEDELWASHERRLLAQGIVVQHPENWNPPLYNLMHFLIGMGLMLLMCAVMVKRSEPVAMSDVTIMGHHLTQAEWDACGRDESACALAEVMRQQAEKAR